MSHKLIAVRSASYVILSLILFFSFSFSAVYGLKNRDTADAIELARKWFSGIVYEATLREARARMPLPNSVIRREFDASARWGPDVIVSVDDALPAEQSESSIAVNPLNPNNLVAGSHDLSLRFVDVAYYYSFDGGATWTHRHRLPGTDARPNAGDPVVAFDSNGNAYYAYIWGDFAYQYISVAVSKSTDGGVTWGSPKVIFHDPDGYLPFAALDKEWIEVDNWAGSPYRNTIYLTATRFAWPFPNTIVFSRSTNGGLSWSSPVSINDASFYSLAPDQLSMIAPAPDGSVYVAWLDLHFDGFGGTDTVNVRRGLSGGESWEPIKKIQTITGLGNIGQSRAASNPTIVVAPKPPGTNPVDYNVYVAYSAIGMDNEPEIRLARSTDKGETWSIVHVFDVTYNGIEFQEFFPALSGQANGIVNLIGGGWTSIGGLYGIGRTFSTDGGITWSGFTEYSGWISDTGYRLNSLTGSPTYEIGDYFDIDVGPDGKVHPIWTGRLVSVRRYNDIITDDGP